MKNVNKKNNTIIRAITTCGLFMLMGLFSIKTQAQIVTNPSNTPGYDSVKLSSIPPENPSTGGRLQNTDLFNSPPVTNINVAGRQATSTCWIPVDASYGTFAGNDDGSIGPFPLGFSFNLYGTNYTQVWINNNGNLTFTGAFSTFTASGFPTSTPMVAPFWSDVDTRPAGSNKVRYKFNATNLIVTYENVGYYANHIDKLNTFQVIISNGNDPLIGIGNNVAFYYKDMQWTTGDASSGVGGFGGTPATVGINKGNSVNYVQIGRFGLNSAAYDGGGGATDGIDYLDNECFAFNVSNAVNQPPSVNGVPPGNAINLACGETRTFTLTFNPPEVGQSVSTTVNTGGLCNTTVTTTSGTVSTATVTITGSPCNEGSNVISFTATDNFNPTPASTTVDVTINVGACCVNPVITCPTSTNITVNNDPGICGANVSFVATATGTSPTISYSKDPGTLFPVGTTAVTATATNSCGTSSCTFDVIVIDNEAPAVPVLADVTGECSATASIATTTDVCAGTVTGTTSDPLSYSTQGTHVIHWTFDDGNGNSTTANQNVIIADVTAPTISCPASIVLSACQSTATWTEPAGNDNCTGWTVARTGPAPGSTFANGSTTTITYTVTDIAGHTADCSFTVTRDATLGATVTNSNPVLYFGFTLDQLAKITTKPSGGTGPYTVAYSMNRPINCNLVNSSGDEIWTHGASTALDSNITCVSTSGPNTRKPGSTSTNTITSSTGYTLDVTLMQDATIYITVTDSKGCKYLDSTKIHAEDVRCFAGNSNNAKVTVCHRTGSTSNPCVKICIDQNAVQEHLSHGDFLGNCTPGCVAPVYNRGVPVFSTEPTADKLDITVMPNPTTSFFEVAITAKVGIPVTMTAYDVYGRVVFKNSNVDVNKYNQIGQQWKGGNYFIEVIQGNERKVVKLIKLN